MQALLELVKSGNDLLLRFLNGEMYMRLSLGELGSTATEVQQPSIASLASQVVLSKQPVETAPCTASAYTMSRSLTRISELWREWNEGITARPSVESLEKIFDARWCLSARESKFFSRRKVIVQHVEATMAARRIDAAAALALSEAEQGVKSLDVFSKFLNWMKRA